MKKVLLCDVDGTLFNSRDWWDEALYYTANILGFYVPPPNELHELVNNTSSLSRIYKICAPDINLEECLRIHRARQEKTVDMVAIFDGVFDTLKTLHEADVALAIVTNRRPREPLLATLTKYGLDAFFKVIVCDLDVKNPKPDPEGVLLALRKLGIGKDKIDRNNTYIVGDNPVDIRAGKGAGIKTIGFLYSSAREALFQECADYYAENFSEVSNIVLA